MIDIFENEKVNLENLICHTGGAEGSDTIFENETIQYGGKVKAYSYKTEYHKSSNKVEISDDDYKEGIAEINKANHWLARYGAYKYMNLLARNWAQVKYSNIIIAVGAILKPGEKSSKGYKCNSKYESVDGGTGYAVQMAINNNKPVFVFDQIKNKWFRWSYTSMSFIETECPTITNNNFAGIGTRQINKSGIEAIKSIFKKLK